MAITLRSGTPKLPQAIAFDCYRTLFDNSHDDWKTTFDEIIKTQKFHLPLKNSGLAGESTKSTSVIFELI